MLTRREQELISLAQQGLTNRQIAERLVVAYDTVRTHFRNIHRKLQVRNRTQLIITVKKLPQLD